MFKVAPRNSLPGIPGGGEGDSSQEQESHEDFLGNGEENLHSHKGQMGGSQYGTMQGTWS